MTLLLFFIADVIDEEKLRKLQYRVYVLERDNYKTKKLKDNEVVECADKYGISMISTGIRHFKH